MQFGNSLAAIAAGVISNYAVDQKPLTHIVGVWHYGADVSPFDLSSAVLVVTFALVTCAPSCGVGRHVDCELSCE